MICRLKSRFLVQIKGRGLWGLEIHLKTYNLPLKNEELVILVRFQYETNDLGPRIRNQGVFRSSECLIAEIPGPRRVQAPDF